MHIFQRGGNVEEGAASEASGSDSATPSEGEASEDLVLE